MAVSVEEGIPPPPPMSLSASPGTAAALLGPCRDLDIDTSLSPPPAALESGGDSRGRRRKGEREEDGMSGWDPVSSAPPVAWRGDLSLSLSLSPPLPSNAPSLASARSRTVMPLVPNPFCGDCPRPFRRGESDGSECERCSSQVVFPPRRPLFPPPGPRADSRGWGTPLGVSDET
jgi:DNA-directed RNA polymerase subunit RPC12/RpoP